MNDDFNRCYQAFSQSKINGRDFLDCIKAIKYTNEDVIEALRDCISLKDWKRVTIVIWIIHQSPSPLFTPLLCELLARRENDDYLEAIADALIDIRDENSVASILKALNWSIPGDDDFHFNRKLLLALYKIGTPLAIHGLKEALNSKERLIRREAQLLLQNIENEI